MNKSNASIRLIILFLFFPFLVFNQSTKISPPDYHNFYGISWRGTVHENLLYAKQMGYDYIFYKQDMEKDSLANDFFFYIESPEYLAYNRTINLRKEYTKDEILFYKNYSVTVNDSLPFPFNLATGWFFNDSTFSAEPNFQKNEVIDLTINKIFDKISEIEKINSRFHFGGFAWDVPQLTGDFWSGNLKKGGRQVSLEYWKRKSVYRNIDNLNYIEGRAKFYKTLFLRSRQKYPEVRFVIEPYKIYDDWLKMVENRIDIKEFMPDIFCQESCGTEFINDQRIYDSGLVRRNQVASTTPNCFEENDNRVIAAKAAINGASFGWFGRFGGTGGMPDYKSIKEVPPRLKLIRVLTGWERANNTPIAQRNWDGVTYSSDNALVNANIIAIRKPTTKTFFVVFLSKNGVFEIPYREKVFKVLSTDSLFRENYKLKPKLYISKNKIKPKNESIGKGFIILLK